MEKQKIIEYLMTTPLNTNVAILKSILVDYENRDEIIAYALKTPHNMNKRVLETLLMENESNKEATVGNAVVGTAIVG